ncbi:MAG: hypothetical protein QUS08_06115 [Methanothrix sp.]|nr:hypothetical protein [Methanothrix sp.]
MLLELDADEQLRSWVEASVRAQRERDRMISDTLEGMLQEVDRLLSQIDEMEDGLEEDGL